MPEGTSSGQVLRLRGQGLPTEAGARADLLVEVSIVVPEALDARQRELFEQLREAADTELTARRRRPAR